MTIDRQFCLDQAAAHRKSTTAQNKAHAAAYEALAARLAPVPPVVVPPVVVPPVAPRFSVVGRDIIGPDGRKFVPVGANGGVWDGPNGFSSLGTMAGHVADAKAWGWNLATGESQACLNYLLQRGEVSWEIDPGGVAWYRRTPAR